MRLIFHIGAGKTGTSSIQKALDANKETLLRNGLWYLGLMLENTNIKHYSWQSTANIEQFHSLPIKERQSQIKQVLNSAVAHAKANNIHTLIWSNESFLGRHKDIGNTLNDLQKSGVSIEIVVYLRNYSSWIRSAYIQWGIKHKTYNGPVQTFDEWIEKNKPDFYSKLLPWIESFADSVKFRNYELHKDVVKDFSELIGLNENISLSGRRNSSPSYEELLLRALFNNHFNTKVRPAAFESAFISKKLAFNLDLNEWLAKYLPSQIDINQFLLDCEEDRINVNKLLRSNNQSELDTEVKDCGETKIDYNKLLSIVTQLVINQAVKIQSLENEILKLQLNQNNSN